MSPEGEVSSQRPVLRPDPVPELPAEHQIVLPTPWEVGFFLLRVTRYACFLLQRRLRTPAGLHHEGLGFLVRRS